MSFDEWSDSFGLYHNVKNPHPMDSENAPLFTALHLMMEKLLGQDVSKKAQIALQVMGHDLKFANYAVDYLKNNGEKINTQLSHDNYLGVMALHKLAGWKFHFYYNFRAMKHPVRLCQFLWLQYPWLLPCWLVWFVATCYSMTRKVKVRDHGVFPAADNKQIVWLICQAWNLKLHFKLFSWILSKNEAFRTWDKVFFKYRTGGVIVVPDHPTIVMSRELYAPDSMD